MQRAHLIRLDISSRTFLAICKCGWRSDCYTRKTDLDKAVSAHQRLAYLDRRARHEEKRRRHYRRP